MPKLVKTVHLMESSFIMAYVKYCNVDLQVCSATPAGKAGQGRPAGA